MLLYLGGALAGTEVNLKVRRAGRDLDVAVVLAKNANPLPAIVTSPAPSYQGLSVDYSSIRMLQLFNARNPLRAIPPQGVAVRELEPNSPAEKEFQNAGEGVSNWLITQVDGVAVTNPSEFYKAMNGKARAKLTLVDPTNPNRSVVVALP
jgi:S1-C subfamily serine protease